MAVTMDRFKQGIIDYGNKEFVAKTPGLSKWMVAMSLPSIAEYVCRFMMDNHRMLCDGGFMTEDGMVNVDHIYSEAISAADKTGPVTQHIPLLGDVHFNKDDINELYQAMM